MLDLSCVITMVVVILAAVLETMRMTVMIALPVRRDRDTRAG